MKKIIFLFLLVSISFSQKNGIRSLNGALENTQKMVFDTTQASFGISTSNGVHSFWIPYRLTLPSFSWRKSGSSAVTDSIRYIQGSGITLTQSGNTLTISASGGGSVGNADSLGYLPASDWFLRSDTVGLKSRLLKNADSTTMRAYSDSLYGIKANTNIWTGTNYHTVRNFFTSQGTDTISAYSTGNKIYIQDTLNVSGNIKVGESQYIAGKQTHIFGKQDSSYTTATNIGGGASNYIFGYNNTIGLSNPTGTYGNWIFGQYLRSEGIGNWLFGSDDNFQKKIVPLQASVGFINEKVIHWGSNTMGLFGYMLSYATQTPHVKDSIRFGWRLTKYGSAVDTLANGGFALEGQRGWTVNSSGVMSNEGTRIKRYFSINDNDDDAWHFNSSNTSGKPFGNIYVDSAHFIVSAGYLDGDSIKLNGTTVHTTTYHSGIGASALGNITTGSVNAQTNTITSGNVTSSGTISTTGTGAHTFATAGSGFTVYRDGGSALMLFQTYGNANGSIYAGYAYGGTKASPTQISAGQFVGTFRGNGYINANDRQMGHLQFYSSSTPSATNYGAYARFQLVPDSSTTMTTHTLLSWTNGLPDFTIGTTAKTGTGNLYIDSLYIGTTLIIDGSRNISSGAITSTGLHTTDSLRVKGANYLAIDTTTVSITLNNQYTILCNNTSNITLTLPALALAYNSATKTGKVYNIKKNANNSATITVDANASETIDGDLTQIISAYKTNMVIQASATGWVIL